jgi:predicted secreted Zn-dependent protease
VKPGRLLRLACSSLALLPVLAAAQMYRCEGPGGVVTYSDRPCGPIPFAKEVRPGASREPPLAQRKTENPWMPLSVEYYDVRGSDPGQLRRAILLKGTEATGQWAIGLTWHHLKYSIGASPSREGCRLRDPKVMTENKILIPRWVDETDAEPRLRAEMHAIVKSTEVHELTHVDINKRAAHELLQALREMPSAPSCDALLRQAHERWQSVRDSMVKRHNEFDRAEIARKINERYK